jgi:hypothetical protein
MGNSRGGHDGLHACPDCGKRRRSRVGQRCDPCYRKHLAEASTTEGPRPTDAPAIHEMHARALLGLPLFAGPRERTPATLVRDEGRPKKWHGRKRLRAMRAVTL